MTASSDLIRFTFMQGPGKSVVTEPMEMTVVDRETDVQLPIKPSEEPYWQLPIYTNYYLEETRFPEPVSNSLLDKSLIIERILRALVMAFGIQRREPSNQYNDHRSYPSVRSRFPISVFFIWNNKCWYLDVYQHALIPIANGYRNSLPNCIVLAGRWAALPEFYGRLRGPLVDLELGINLRNLCTALSVWNIDHLVSTPNFDSASLLDILGLDSREWCLPITIMFDEAVSFQAFQAQEGQEVNLKIKSFSDGSFSEVYEFNRRILSDCDGTGAVGTWGLENADANCNSWAEVLWERSSGRMPRELPGFDALPTSLSSEALNDALSWLNGLLPTKSLQNVMDHINIHLALRENPGCFPGGVYSIVQGEFNFRHSNASIMQELERAYGPSLSVANGVAIRHTAAVWFFTVNVPELLSSCGDAGWTLAQYCVGWLSQGLSIAAAAHHMWSRPTRAFEDILLQPVLGLNPGVTTILALPCGVARYSEPMLDLRT